MRREYPWRHSATAFVQQAKRAVMSFLKETSRLFLQMFFESTGLPPTRPPGILEVERDMNYLMWYLVWYLVTGATLAAISVVATLYLEKINADRYALDIDVEELFWGTIFWPFTSLWWVLLYVGVFIRLYYHRLSSRKIVAMIMETGLERLDTILITFKNGEQARGGFSFLDEETSRLGWIRPGNQMSAGGWDYESQLVRIASVKKINPGEPGHYDKKTTWW